MAQCSLNVPRRHCHSGEVELDRLPTRTDGSDPMTPLLQVVHRDEEEAIRRPTMLSRWRRLYRHRFDLYHPNQKKKITYRVIVFFPLLALNAFMIFV
jgi:hypothetical protein